MKNEFKFSELSKTGKDTALYDFCKYGLSYVEKSAFGVEFVSAYPEDLDDKDTRKKIIKAMDDMRFDKDGNYLFHLAK